jgi:membrane protein implicated in regulation of membrane protease activity
VDIPFWFWLVAGLGLLILEAFAPGAIFLWLGISALVVGVLAWLIPSMSWEIAFVTWGVLSVITVLAWRKYRPAPATDQPALNRRGESYVGRVFTLAEPLVNGVGKLRVDDGQWRIAGDDAPAGARVKVVGVDGATLRVQKE